MKLVLVREQSLKSSEGGMDGARTDIYSAETAIVSRSRVSNIFRQELQEPKHHRTAEAV